MIVRTATSCAPPLHAGIVPLKPVDGCPQSVARLKDYIIIEPLAPAPEADEGPRVVCHPTIAEIQAAVCAHYDLHLSDMTAASRLKIVCHPRQVAMFLSCEMTQRATTEIGRRFGGRDHSTVIHARTVIPQRIAADDELAEAVVAIRAAVMTRVAARAEAIQRQLSGTEARLD